MKKVCSILTMVTMILINLTLVYAFDGDDTVEIEEREYDDDVDIIAESLLVDAEPEEEAPQLIIFDQCNILYDAIAEYDSSSVVRVTITNQSDTDIVNWYLVYSSSATIEAASDIEIIINNGVHYLSYVDSNALIEAGSSISFELEISYNGNYVQPDEFRVYGYEAGEINYLSEENDILLYNGGMSSANTGSGKESECFDSITYNLNDHLYTFNVVEAENIPEYDITSTTSVSGTLSIDEPLISPRIILGNDGRVRVDNVDDYPYSCIAALTMYWADGTRSFGTGFMVSEHHMLTAGHCVYDNEDTNAPVESIRVYFGRRGSRYLRSYWASNVTWESTFPAGRTWQNDWGVISFDENVGDETGWMGVGYISDDDLLAKRVRVTGYPFDMMEPSNAATEGWLRYMYRASNPVRTVGRTYLTYYTDTFNGQSGGPVYGVNDDFVSGIHHSSNQAGTCNVGRRVNSAIFNHWMNQGFIHY